MFWIKIIFVTLFNREAIAFWVGFFIAYLVYDVMVPWWIAVPSCFIIGTIINYNIMANAFDKEISDD